MARYGDIVEINGEFFEFTPVGYVPVSAPSTDGGMLTMPADTITPSPTGDVIVKEEPTTTTTQTEPTGTPTSDPTKTQPGETGPFDPNAEPPAPAPAPEPETELAPPKPLPDTKDAEPEAETEGVTTFTFFRGVELGDANPNALYNRGEATQVTQAELQEYFNEEGSGMLREAFGDFNNYLAYMTEREQLIQSGDYDVGNWDEYTGSLTEDELMILEGEDLTQYSDSDQDVYTEAYGQRMQEQSSAYDRWINSDENQALLSKYGVNSIFYNSDGDKYEWNGSAYVKTVKQEQMGVGDYVKAGIVAAMGYYMGGALSEFFAAPTTVPAGSEQIAGLGWNSSIATGAAQGIANAATQLVMTGDVDFGEALESAITAGLGAEALRQIRETGVLDQLVDSVMEYTEDQRWVSLEDGTLFKIVDEFTPEGLDVRILMPNGGTLSYENFLQFASEGAFGSPVLLDAVGLPVEIFRAGLQTPEFLDNIIQAASDAYDTQGSVTQSVVNFLAGAPTAGSGTGPQGATVSGNLNLQSSGGLTVLNQLRELLETTTDPDARADIERQIEAYEQEAEETETTTEPEEDILADTTQEATGLEVEEPGITEAMFQDVVDQVREDGVVQTQEIIDAINALGVADLPTLAQIQEAFPELQAPSLTEIGNTISTLLSDADLLTAEEFADAMAGVLTPEQLATALANLPYGDAEDFIDAVANAGYATPENIAQLLNERDLMSNEDFSTYMEQFREDVVGDVGTLLDEALEDFPFPETFTEAQIEQLRETIVIPEGASMEQIQEALNRLADQLPAEAPTLEEMSTLLNNALDGLDIASPEDVRTALAEFNFSEAQIAQIINALPEGLNKVDLADALEGIVVGEDLDAAVTTITDLIGDLKIASTEDIRTLLSEYGFTDAQLQQISQAVNIPESVTLAELRQELDNLPEELTAQEVIDLMLESNIATKSDFQTMLDEAFENFAFPETFTEAQIKQIKDSIVFPSTASMDQIQTALDRLAEQIPEAGPSLDEIQKLFTDTLGGLAIASPQDVRDALSEFEFSESQINQIINALPENISNSDLATALEGIVVGEDLDAAVTKITEAVGALNIASPEDIKTILSEYGFTDAQLQQIVNALPEGLSLEQVQTSLSSALEGIATGASLEASTTKIVNALGELDIASPQDVKDALAEFNFSDAQIAQIINALPENINNKDLKDALEGVVVGEDLDAAVTTITEAIGGLKIASPQDVRDILANYGFTDAQLEQIAGAVTIPPSATIQDVQRIVDGIPAGLTAEQVATQLSEDFEGLTKGIAGVQSGIDELAESLGLSTDGLLTAISNLGTTTGEGLTDLQTDILKGLGDLSEDLGLEISDVVTSVTDLGTDVADGIEGLGEQLTGIGEGIGGVQEGIDDLAEDLGLSTDALILAISNLGTATGEDLTGLETSVLTGLETLAENLGLDIGEVVTSVTDLGTDFTENIADLSDQLTGVEEAVGGVTTAVTEGVEDLADALGVQTDDIEAAIVTLGSGLGGELTELETNVLLGLTGLADSFGTDVETIVDSITGVGTGLGENVQDLSNTLTEQLGTGFEGIGGQLESGFGQLGQQLGLATLGLFGLGAKQPTAQEIAMAQDKFEFTPFEETARPRQVQQVVQARPVQQQPTALQQLNQFIDRQTTTPQVQPINQGMFTSDPNRKLA